MGMIDHLVPLLGFSLAAFVCLICLSGRGKHSHYERKRGWDEQRTQR